MMVCENKHRLSICIALKSFGSAILILVILIAIYVFPVRAAIYEDLMDRYMEEIINKIDEGDYVFGKPYYFGIAYINNDNIPDLVILYRTAHDIYYFRSDGSFHGGGYSTSGDYRSQQVIGFYVAEKKDRFVIEYKDEYGYHRERSSDDKTQTASYSYFRKNLPKDALGNIYKRINLYPMTKANLRSRLKMAYNNMGNSLKLSTYEKKAVKGTSFKLKAYLNQKEKKVSWTSSNNKIAKVDQNGKVKGVKPGKVVITASLGELSERCIVTITKPTIKLSKKTLSLKVGKKKRLKAKVSGKSSKVKWKSSNKRIAVVSNKGVVTAKKAGKVTITAIANGVKAKCKLTVKAPKKKKTTNPGTSAGTIARTTRSSGAASTGKTTSGNVSGSGFSGSGSTTV